MPPPVISQAAPTQDAAASPSVTVSAAAVAVAEAPAVAAERGAAAAAARDQAGPPVPRRLLYPSPASLRPYPAFIVHPSLCSPPRPSLAARWPASRTRAPSRTAPRAPVRR